MNIAFTQFKKWLLPVAVLAGAYVLAMVIRAGGPTVDIIAPQPQATVVRVVTARAETVQLTVESQGEAGAEHSIDLVSELAGKVRQVSPAFVSGGYFSTDDVLVQVDPTDYELAKIRAAAAVAEAEEDLAIEKSEAKLASQGLFPMMEAKVASAEARLQSAKAELAQAEADLSRTRIRAPFDGRVLFTQADPGQYVAKGASIARVFSTGRAQIRLPLTDEQLKFLDSPFGSGRNGGRLNTPVTLRAAVGGRPAEWQGYLDRMDGAVDDNNRVWYAVAYVDDPYDLQELRNSAPLVVGLFVEAEITGRRVENVYRLPRSALRNEDHLLIVDADNRLRQRRVEVLRTDFASVYVASGLTDGERICVSPIDVFVDGLLVEAVEAPEAPEAADALAAAAENKI